MWEVLEMKRRILEQNKSAKSTANIAQREFCKIKEEKNIVSSH